MSRQILALFVLLLLPGLCWARGSECELWLWKAKDRALKIVSETSLRDLYKLFAPIPANSDLTSGQEIEGFVEGNEHFASEGLAKLESKLRKVLDDEGIRKVEMLPVLKGDDFQQVATRFIYYVNGDKQKLVLTTDENLSYLPPRTMPLEIISPILSTAKEIRIFEKCVKAAKKAGFVPIASGGVHIHNGFEANNAKIAAILKAWIKIEDGVLNAFSIHNDRKIYISRLDPAVVDLIASEALKDPEGTATKFEKGQDNRISDLVHGEFRDWLKARYFTRDYEPALENQEKRRYLTLNKDLNDLFARLDQEIFERMKRKADSDKFQEFRKRMKDGHTFRVEDLALALGVKNNPGSRYPYYQIDSLPLWGRDVALNLESLRRHGTGELRIFNSTVNLDLLEFQREFSKKFFLAVLTQSESFSAYLKLLDQGRAFNIFELAEALNIEGGERRLRKILTATASEASEQLLEMDEYNRLNEEYMQEDPI